MVRIQRVSCYTGEILRGFDVIDNWDKELEEMNKGKVGESFHYPDTFVLLLGCAKVYFHLPYRLTEGIVKEHVKGKLPSIPDYSTISRRINQLDIRINENIKNKLQDKDDDHYIIVAIYSIGIKVTNIGQWMNQKWKVASKNRNDYLKIQIAVNIKSKKILSMRVTEDEQHVHDSKMLPDLVDEVATSNRGIMDKPLADGAYDSNDIFRYLSDNGIMPCIKVRKNARIKKTGNLLRNLAVIAQRNGVKSITI